MCRAMAMRLSTGRCICQGLDGRSGADGGGPCAFAHGFAAKPRLALAMIVRAIAANAPFAWVAADTVYGVGEIEKALRRAGKGYVLGVPGNHLFRSWRKRPPIAGMASEIAHALDPSLWKRLSAGEGTKGAGSTTGPIASWPISTLPI